MTAPTEIGSATVQVWVRKEKERRAIEANRRAFDEEWWRIVYPPIPVPDIPKPWLRDAIRKWWKGELG